MKRFTLFILSLFFLPSCSPSKAPNLKGPFLDTNTPLSSEVKAGLMKNLREGLLQCDGSLSIPELIGYFSNPFQLKIWNKGIQEFQWNSPGKALKEEIKKGIQQACRHLSKKKLNRKAIKQVETQISFAFEFQTLDSKRFEEKREELIRTMGLWGILFNDKQKPQWWYPFDLLEKNLKFKEIFQEICGRGFTPRDCVRKHKGKLKTFRVIDLVSIPEKPYYLDLFRLAPVVTIETFDSAFLRKRLQWMRDWYLNNLSPDGEMTYVYRPYFGKRSKTHNNMVRQFMATLTLFRLGKYLDDKPLLSAAEKNLVFNLKNYMKVEEDKGIAYIYFRKKANLGAAAFALMSLLESKEHPDRKKLIQKFSNFILALYSPDGSFKTFYFPASRNDRQNLYPGQALLALMTLYESDPSQYQPLLDKVERSFRYYRKLFKEKPDPTFVPWHTMAFYKNYKVTKNKDLAPFIFEMNDFLIEIQNTPKGTKTPEPDTMGRFYDPKKNQYGPPHASNTALYTGGLIDAYYLASDLSQEKRVVDYWYAIFWGLRSLFQLQYLPETTFYIPDKKAVVGALHTTVTNSNIRIDNIQNATMAFLNLLTKSGPNKTVPKKETGTEKQREK